MSAPTYLSFATASVSVLIAIVASAGNSLLVLAVLFDPNKNLRSPFNYFVANLAVADLIVGVITGPLSAVFHFAEGFKHPLKQKIQEVLYVTYFISCTASLLSLTALALDRYVAIAFPLFYRAKLNPFRAFAVSTAVWVMSVLLSMIYFLVEYNVFRFVFANTSIAVTFAVLIFTYTRIFKHLRFQVRQWDDLHDSQEENLAKKQAMMWEKKITKTLVIVLTLFLACYLPSCICIYIINFCASCDCDLIHWARDIQFVLVMANSGVNPFVYAWRLENFRKAFKVIVNCGVCCRRLRSISLNLLSTVSAEAFTVSTTAEAAGERRDGNQIISNF